MAAEQPAPRISAFNEADVELEDGPQEQTEQPLRPKKAVHANSQENLGAKPCSFKKADGSNCTGMITSR